MSFSAVTGACPSLCVHGAFSKEKVVAQAFFSVLDIFRKGGKIVQCEAKELKQAHQEHVFELFDVWCDRRNHEWMNVGSPDLCPS